METENLLDWCRKFLPKLNFCENIVATTIFIKQSLIYSICDFKRKLLLYKNYGMNYIFTQVHFAEEIFGST